LAFVISLMAGMVRDLIERGTSLLLGHIQVHATGYRPDRSIFDTIPGNGVELANDLQADPEVLGAAPRVSGYGLVSAGEQSAGAELLGIAPGLESGVSTLHEHLMGITPADAATLPGARQILIGERLAKTLAVTTGAELVVLTEAADGSLGNDVYTVAGVFKTGVDLVDGGLAVMNLADLQGLLALGPERVHEIAVRTADPRNAPGIAERLARQLESRGVEVAAWPNLAPEISAYVAMTDGWMWIMYLIVLSLATIAVLNTMLMAVFERFREFGVLSAIGMRPLHIVLLVVVEVAALAGVSLVAATALGTPLLRWLVHSGIDLRHLTEGFTLSGVPISPILRGAWAVSRFATSAVLLIAFALVAGLYPAVRAARVDPSALTRGELR
jgi:putative ABC transport system permease protein